MVCCCIDQPVPALADSSRSKVLCWCSGFKVRWQSTTNLKQWDAPLNMPLDRQWTTLSDRTTEYVCCTVLESSLGHLGHTPSHTALQWFDCARHWRTYTTHLVMQNMADGKNRSQPAGSAATVSRADAKKSSKADSTAWRWIMAIR